MRRLALLALVVVAGCRKSGGAADAGLGHPPDPDWLAGRLVDPPGAPRDGGALTVRLPIEPTGLTRLHDRFAEGTMTRITVGPVYETLARLRDGALTPLLAQSWEESADHLELRVTLRSGVRFHDGAPLTSADVKRTLEVVMDPRNATSALRGTLAPLLSRVETPTQTTVVFRWKQPYFLAAPTVLGAIPVLPAHALEGDFDTLPLHRAPIGTGPFRFSRWDAGTALVYERFEAYWGRRAHLERVVFRFIKDDTAALAALERGEVDLFVRLTPQAWRGMEAHPERFAAYQRVFFPENTYAWLGFNQRKPLFQDAKVRRALAHLFPAELVERTVDLGLEPRTTCPYLPGSPSCDPGVGALPHAPAEAKRLLAEAGWRDTDGDGVLDREGRRFSFSFLVSAQSQKMARLLPLYLESLQRAGLDAQLETVDVSAYLSRVRAHDFDAMALSWSSPDAAQDNFQNFHSSQRESGSNFVGYADPEVDAWLEAIRVEFDPRRRAQLERRVHRRVYEDQAYLFLGRRPSLDAVKRRVRGLTPSLGWYELSAVWLAD